MTLIGPVVAPLGTLVVICVSEFTVSCAAVPLKATAVAAVKPDPEIVTAVPTGPLEGLNMLTTGGPSTVKLVELVAVPFGVVTPMAPVFAPLGTEVLIRLSEPAVNVAEVPLNFTLVAPVKPEPLIVTLDPTWPLVGEKEVMVGGKVTAKLNELVPVPADVVMVIGSLVAPLGTEVLIWLSEPTVNVADVPLNFTDVVPVNP